MNRSELVRTLELVGLALATDDLVPIFKQFCFTGDTVFACNDNLAIIAPCDTLHEFAVHGPTLLGLLQASTGDDVEITFKDHDCVVKTGRSTFKLPWEPQENFLFKEPENEWPTTYSLDDDLLTGLEHCLATASVDNTQPALMGCYLNSKEHTLYSCDGDALTRYIIGPPRIGSSLALLPNKFCEAVLKIRGETKELGIGLEISTDWARATIGPYVIYGRLTTNEKPLDHSDLIKRTLKTEPDYVPVPKGLDGALSRARVVADPVLAKTVLTVDNGRLHLLTETQHGVIRDNMKFAGHAEVEAGVSAALVQRSIKPCDQMAIAENCTAYKSGDKLFILLSNMDAK